MTNEDENLIVDLIVDLIVALAESDQGLLQAKNRIALLEHTLRDTERELLRVKTEKAELQACNAVDSATENFF